MNDSGSDALLTALQRQFGVEATSTGTEAIAVFVPSEHADGTTLDHGALLGRVWRLFGALFGGATVLEGKGLDLKDPQAERVSVVLSFTTNANLTRAAPMLVELVGEFHHRWNQRAVLLATMQRWFLVERSPLRVLSSYRVTQPFGFTERAPDDGK